jgi:threonylcarbamoyladenosine tRNA methylthiotransferase MtaB
MPAVDVIIGNNNKMKLLEIVENHRGENTTNVLDIDHEGSVENFNISETNDKTRAFIRIQDGCNQFCSYCIIPYVRGRIRSKKVNDVIQEIENLRDHGYKEIVFTGIHVASYGKDLEGSIDLIDLLLKANAVEGIKRLRLSSIEPTYLTKANTKRLSEVTKLADHFHLSLQSGSNSILKRMNRNYTTKDYLEVVQDLRSHFDTPAITTDIIVAFPGETEEEFKETCDFVKKVKFSQVHVFKYSKREGTRAAKMDGQIHGNIASERSQILRDLTDQLEKEYIQSQMGIMHDVLVETYDEKHNFCTGHTGNYLNVAMQSKIDLTNEFINVKIDTVANGQIFARIERRKSND